jgi:hypothetical protein
LFLEDKNINFSISLPIARQPDFLSTGRKASHWNLINFVIGLITQI